MKKNAVVIDVYSHGSYHEVINQAYIMMISELYEHVTYIADKSACDNIKHLLVKCGVGYDNVTFEEKRIKPVKIKSPGLNYFYKLVKVSFLNYWYYINSPKNVDVFYNNNLFFASFLISFFAIKSKSIYDMCHNEMELIDRKEAYSFVTKLLSIYFKFIFNRVKLNSAFHFILLSPKMVGYFKTFISEKNHAYFYSIDHSYIRPSLQINNTYLIKDNRVKVGIPGAINDKRGLPILKQILNQLENSNVCIYALSSCAENIVHPNFVILNKSKDLLPFEQYNAYVKSMDVMLLLYDKESYKLTASGAVLEAIWNEKPIIAFHNMYFDYLFDKFGSMGKLADSVEELVCYIKKYSISETDIIHCTNAKQKLMPQAVSEQLKLIIKNV